MKFDNTAIFLDRDGTINEELEFISNPDEVNLIPRAAEAIRAANKLGFKVIVITNQSGIARGLIKEEELKIVHNKLVELLELEGAHLDAIYFCPHHPDIGDNRYRILCDCRKPNSGMLKYAQEEFNIDLQKSYVVGDRIIDLQTANSVGAHPILVLTGYGKNQLEILKSENIQVDYIAKDLYEAIQFIIKSTQQFLKNEND